MELNRAEATAWATMLEELAGDRRFLARVAPERVEARDRRRVYLRWAVVCTVAVVWAAVVSVATLTVPAAALGFVMLSALVFPVVVWLVLGRPRLAGSSRRPGTRRAR